MHCLLLEQRPETGPLELAFVVVHVHVLLFINVRVGSRHARCSLMAFKTMATGKDTEEVLQTGVLFMSQVR